MQQDPTGWTPPPPPEDDSVFSSGTREYYKEEIKKGATKALVLSILSFFCCAPIFGYLAWSAASDVLTNIDVYDVGHDKRGMAVAAKVIVIVALVLWVLGLIFRVAAGKF